MTTFATSPNEQVGKDRRRGRGGRSNATGRFENDQRQEFDDGWDTLGELEAFQTEVIEQNARTIITRNQSPDIDFDQSINAYRGCEHGCSYCYARPTHCYLGHSAGLDFETKLYAKPNAAELLLAELGARNYKPKTIALGTNTDPYQPIERQYMLTRQILEVLQRARHPVGIVTKSALVTRDIDILSEMARDGLVKVALSVTSLDNRMSRKMEPRASAPHRRIEALRQLSEAGIPTAVMVAPIIPALNDSEIEAIVDASTDAGVTEAGYVLLRLPIEVKQLFREWLETEYPDRAARVISILRSMHQGADYEANWGIRQTGRGPYGDQIKQRFNLALRKYGLDKSRFNLRTDLFEPPVLPGGQMSLL